VPHEIKYRDKIDTELKSGVYEPLYKDPAAKVEGKVQQILTKYKAVLPAEVKRKLIPQHRKPPHLYFLPKVHTPDMPLRLIVSSIGSPCFALTGFLNNILSPLAGRSDSFVKNYGHFIKLLKLVNLRGQEILVTFDVVSLFTNIPVYEALLVFRNRLDNDNTLAELSVLNMEAIMELLDGCLRTTDSNSRRIEWQWVVPFVSLLAISTSNCLSIQR
jgi:hypothetical protein